MSVATEFKKLTDEEFNMLSDEEKEHYIIEYNSNFRNRIEHFHNTTEEIKKTIEKLKSIEK